MHHYYTPERRLRNVHIRNRASRFRTEIKKLRDPQSKVSTYNKKTLKVQARIPILKLRNEATLGSQKIKKLKVSA